MKRKSSRKNELSKRGEQPRTYRRVVTENVNGKAVVQNDESLPAYEFKTVPGYQRTLIWVNPATAIQTRSSPGLGVPVFTS